MTFVGQQEARVSVVDQYIFDNIQNIPDPNTVQIGIMFMAKNALFTAVCVSRPDDPTKRVWWPTQSATPVNYHATATSPAASGAPRFGNYAAGNWVQATVIGQSANGISLTGAVAGAQMTWVGIGIQTMSYGAAVNNGDVVMTSASGQAIAHDGNPANAKLGMSLQRTTGATSAPTLLFTFNP